MQSLNTQMLCTSVNKFHILPITFPSLQNIISSVLVVFALELKKHLHRYLMWPSSNISMWILRFSYQCNRGSCLLYCDAALLGKMFWSFQRNVFPSSSRFQGSSPTPTSRLTTFKSTGQTFPIYPCFSVLTGILYEPWAPEDEGNTFLQNVGSHLPSNGVTCSRSPESFQIMHHLSKLYTVNCRA